MLCIVFANCKKKMKIEKQNVFFLNEAISKGMNLYTNSFKNGIIKILI